MRVSTISPIALPTRVISRPRSGPAARLFVVDFSLTARRGPPPNLRIAPEAIIADLGAAGWTARVSPVALPDQYIVEARKER